MALIDLDKFLASFITEMKESDPRTMSIPSCIREALCKQGLIYHDGQIVKNQIRISAEAKENGYGESEDERMRKEIIAILQYKYEKFSKNPKYCNAPQWIAWLEKQGQKPTNKDKELTCKDIEIILGIENHIIHECNYNSQLVIESYPKGEDYYGEILRRFNNQRIKPQRIVSAETKEAMCDKTAWSEEDKENFKGVMDAFVNNYKKYIKGE